MHTTISKNARIRGHMGYLIESAFYFYILTPMWLVFASAGKSLFVGSTASAKLAAFPVAAKVALMALLAIPAFLIALISLMALAFIVPGLYESPGKPLNLSVDSIWTGANLKEKIMRELGRSGIFIASFLLAHIVWMLANPGISPWSSGHHAVLFCGVWQIVLMPIIWVALGGVTLVRGPLRMSYYQVVNATLRRISRK